MSDSRANAAALPTIRLTDTDRREYASIVDESFRETLALYEDFAYRRARQMDASRWKLVRTRESMRVYRARSSSNSSDGQLSTGSSPSLSSTGSGHPSIRTESSLDDDDPLFTEVEIGPGSSLSANTKVPVLVSTGLVPGSLDDMLYGTFADDALTILRRSMYVKDGMEDAVVLATLDGPSESDPYNSLAVVWMLRSSTPMIRRRDFLVLMKHGTATTSTGERIGVGVAQSVSHPDLPELRERQIVRGVVSYCIIYRQLADQQVETFIQIVIDPRGTAMTYFVTQETVNALLGMSNPIECSLRKKLVWFLRRARRQRAQTDAAHGESSSSSSSSKSQALAASRSGSPSTASSGPTSPSNCVHCAKPVNALLGAQGTRCSICQQVRSMLSWILLHRAVWSLTLT